MLSTVEEEVQQADESSRANPRGRRRLADKALNARRMAALERTTSATRDLAATLARAADEDIATDAEASRHLARAVRACADIVGAATDDPRAEQKLTAASEALDELLQTLNRHPTGNSRYMPAYAYAAAVCVHRIVLASEEFIDPA